MKLFFAELLVRGTLLCLLAALALLLMRRAAAAYRHLICTLALCGLLALPLLQTLLPPLPVLTTAAKPVATAALIAPEPIPQPLPSDPPVPSLPQGGWRSEGRTKPGGYGWVPPGELPTPRDFSFLCPLLWALGASLLLLRLTVALVRLRTLARQSQRTTFLETEILVSAHIATPLTWGVRRPVILLPAALLSGDPAVVESALRHEQAHIARRDWLWHLLAEVVCALCWFQPGAWWLRRQLRAESERACDDRVLLSGISGPDYAAHLLEILRAGRASALAPGMAASGSMEVRVKHILDPKKPRHSHGLRLALTAALGLVLLPLASLKVSAKPGERSVSRLQAAVERLTPRLASLTPGALLVQAKATLTQPVLSVPQPLTPLAAPPQLTTPTEISGYPLKSVAWGRAIEGLEPGLVLETSSQIPLHSQASYHVLVRNTTESVIDFMVQCLPYDDVSNGTVPALLPENELAEILAGKAIPQKYCAKGAPHTALGLDACYIVTLGPGETVEVPGTYSLYLGEGDEDLSKVSGDSPSLAAKPGKHWLVQPITLRRISPVERAQRNGVGGSFLITKFDRTGKVYTESPRITVAFNGGTILYAKVAVEIAAPGRNTGTGDVIPLNNVVWGDAVDGLEPGLLLLSSKSAPQNSKVVYQTLLRNKSNKPITFFVRMLRTNGPDRPSFGVKQAEGVGELPPLDPLYEATLAPGEAMLVPVQQSIEGTQELVIGDDGSKDRPRVSKIVPGQYRLSQPVTVYRSLKKSQLIGLLGSAVPEIKKISPDGTLRTERSSRAGGTALPGAQTLDATRMLDVVAALPSAPGPTLPLDKVIWNEAVDGLQAGFLLTSSARVPLSSKIAYQTLVRNTSNKPISFLTRLLQYDGYETPTVDGKSTKGAKRTYPLDPLYSVTLAPGESVIVPAQNGRENLEIFVGEGGSGGNPSIATITPGHLKIVQPITIYRSPEKYSLADLMGLYTLSKVSPEGRVRTEAANRASGKIDGGQTLEAYIYLEVGTLNAAAERNANAATWGKVDKDLQCGIRLLNSTRSFRVGDTLEAELLWRNTSNAPISTPIPRPLDLYPSLQDAAGRSLQIDFGARFNLYPPTLSIAPKEVRSLGTFAITLVAPGTPSPKSNAEPGHITLTAGTYKLSGSGGVSAQGGPNPKSGEIAFTVVGDAPEKSEVELSLRLPKGVKTFAKLSEARFEVVLRNLGKPTSVRWITPANFSFYGPDLFTKDGEPIPYEHTVAGPYLRESRELASGESVVLGTIQIPREVQERWDSLPQGPYLTSGPPPPSPYEARFSLGITVSGKGEQKLAARLPFTVTQPR